MKHVALLIETSRSYGRDLLRGIKRFAIEHGQWSMFVEVRDLESDPPAWLRNWNGDGILTRSGSQAIAAAVRRVGVPAVELRSTQRSPSLPFVGVDNEAVGSLVFEHLHERGFREFAVYALQTEQFFVDRLNSFTHAVEASGSSLAVLQQPGESERPSQWERQQKRLMQWLTDLPKPVGVMACTDQLGCWLLDACSRAGISVPEEVAVVGVEDDETLTELSTPPLSSVRLDAERTGYEAAKLLSRLMSGRKPRKTPLLLPPVGVTTRESSDVVAIDDPELATAIQYIRQHACDGIRVNDVLRQVPMSRTALERGCRRLLGRSPNMEINRVRIEQAKSCLRDTDMSLDEIARRCGFTTAQYMSQVFKKSTGVTPGTYRSA